MVHKESFKGFILILALVTVFSVSSKLKQNTYKLPSHYSVAMWCHVYNRVVYFIICTMGTTNLTTCM